MESIGILVRMRRKKRWDEDGKSTTGELGFPKCSAGSSTSCTWNPSLKERQRLCFSRTCFEDLSCVMRLALQSPDGELHVGVFAPNTFAVMVTLGPQGQS